MDEIFQVLLQ